MLQLFVCFVETLIVPGQIQVSPHIYTNAESCLRDTFVPWVAYSIITSGQLLNKRLTSKIEVFEVFMV